MESRSPGRGPNLDRRHLDGRDHRHRGHPGRALWPPEDDRVPAPPGPPRLGRDRGPPHDHVGPSRVRRGKKVRTTIPAAGVERAPHLLKRDFTAPAPNRVWVADFTYCRSWAGFVYVAFVVDVYAQRIVAWHASTDKRTDLVLAPVRMALWDRDRQGHPVIAGELISHSDAGSQYTSLRFTERLALEGIAPSIGTVGDCLLTG